MTGVQTCALPILYTRVSDGTNSYWVDYSSQAPANTVNSSTTIIQPRFGGTGVSALPNGLLKGDGTTNPITAAVAGVDYFVIAANGVAVNNTFAAVDVNVEDTLTVGTINAGTINFSNYIASGAPAYFGGLNVSANVVAGNITVVTDMIGQGNLTFGNVTANNLITGVYLIYGGNISYEGNLNVLNVNASNVHLGDYPGGTYIDGSASLTTYAPGATVDFSNFSGSILITGGLTGGSVGVTVFYLCGGQTATAVGTSAIGGNYGVLAYNAAVNGYTWTNNSGSNLDVSFVATKTRNSA